MSTLQRLLCGTVIVVGVIAQTGCSTTTNATNKVVDIPAPQISINNAVAQFEVGQQITGYACTVDYFRIFASKDGASKFLEVYGDGDSGGLGRAKAAAAYLAVNGSGLTTDILVGPVFQITSNSGFISDEYCAKVVGWRGMIKSFKADDTITRPTPPKPKFFESFGNPMPAATETTVAPTPALPKQDININIKVVDCGKKTC